jgi:DNA-binding MurR/RpiR family transcriptional regulator
VDELAEFRQRLESAYPDLTKSEQRIASYLLASHDEAVFVSASGLARRLKVSEATVVRFAKSVGYEGFPSLRRDLQGIIRVKATPASRLQHKLDELGAGQGHVFAKLVAIELDYLTEALNSIQRTDFDRAVAILLRAKRVFFFGMGPSALLADLAELRLRRFGVMTISMTASGRDLAETMQLLRKDDVLLAAGFLRVTPELLAVIDCARSAGCPAILITDTLQTHFRDLVDVVLAARRGPVSTFHSLTVPMSIVNSLILAVAMARPQESLASLERLQLLRADYGLDTLSKTTSGP